MLDFRHIRTIPGLDAARAVAVLLVVSGHFGVSGAIPGGFGVTIFFFISGFLITTLLTQEANETGSVSIKNFYYRRFFRLAPELVAMLLISYTVRASLGDAPAFKEIIAALTYTTNYFWIIQRNLYEGFHPTWPHLWSLSVEEHFYIIFPMAFSLVFLKKGARIPLLAILLIGALLWRFVLVSQGWISANEEIPYTYIASETRIDSIAYGVLFALLAQRTYRFGAIITWLLIAVGGALIIISFFYRTPEFRETLRYSLQGIAFFCVASGVYLGRFPSLLLRLSEAPALKWAGVLSYGAYLWHGEWIYITRKLGILDAGNLPTIERIPLAVAGIVVTFAVAYVSYIYVAKPFQVLRHRYSHRHSNSFDPAAGSRKESQA